MIKKISKIKEFGSFKDFNCGTEIDEYKKFNLFYGWNGSGKTTFSKLFTLLEHKDDSNLIKNLNGYEFKIELENHTITQNNFHLNDLNLYVFNEIFVKNNLDWDNIIKSILLISDEVITEKEELEKYKLELGNEDTGSGVLGRVKKLEYEIKDISDNIDKFNQSSAKKIKEEFKVIDTSDTYYFNYNKKKFGDFVNSNERIILNKDHILSATSVDKLKESIRPNILKEIEFDLKPISLEWLNNVKEKVLNVLTTSIVVNEVKRLKEHQQIGKWVENGIEIHKFYKSTKCEFCNQDLPTTRIEELEKHFNEEFKKLK